MQKKLIALVTVTVLGVYAFNQSSEREVVTESPSKMSSAKAVVAKKTSPAVAPETRTTEIKEEQKIEEKVSPEIQEYRKAAFALAEKIEKLGLDGVELDRLFTRVGKENFLKNLPREIRAEYRQLEEKVNALGKSYVRKDGMTDRFFTKYQAEMPAHLEKQRKALEAVRLPNEVESIVTKKLNEPELNNEEVSAILAGCGKGNTDCINRAFATLIDANHGLDDGQMKLIQEYL